MLNTIFDELYRINREMNNFFRTENFLRYDNWPATNIYENNLEYMLVAQVPGIKKENISITMKDNSLKISGLIAKPEGKDINFHLKERPEGRFERNFIFNDKIDTNKIEAEVKNGLLLLKLPKSQEAKALKINIK